MENTIKLDREELINSKTFCPYPFNHLFVQPNGGVHACCVSKTFENPVNVKDASIKEIVNSQNHIEVRKDMLEGREHKVCKECYVQERNTGHSTRILAINNFKSGLYRTPIVFENYEMDPMLEHIDIRFSNLCNLKCRMCCHTYSSAWYEDSKITGEYNGVDPKVVKVETNMSKKLGPYLDSMRSLYFAGGEPLIMPEHSEFLSTVHNYWMQNLPEGETQIPIAIHYNTNFKVLRHEGVEFIPLWKNFFRVGLAISCDGIEEVGEYQRPGFSTKLFIENLDTIRKHGIMPYAAGNPNQEYSPEKNIVYTFQYTVTILNILHLPYFIKWLLDNNYIDSSSTVDFRYTWHPEEFCVNNIVNKKYTEDYLRDNMPDLDEVSKKTFEELINFMYTEPSRTPNEVDTHLSRLDKLNSKTNKNTHSKFTDVLLK